MQTISKSIINYHVLLIYGNTQRIYIYSIEQKNVKKKTITVYPESIIITVHIRAPAGSLLRTKSRSDSIFSGCY